MASWTSAEVRKEFLRFFKEKGHAVVPSAPLIPLGDPTLMFTNAGMNQFKDYFLDPSKAKSPDSLTGGSPRAVSCQKCLRVSGKHNDFEQVGLTPRHHTFFEMLGNFSFGNYFKEEAINFAWELLTEVYEIAPRKLWITVYKTDKEAELIWEEVLRKEKITKQRIRRFGESENFWSMGETGPCGPCSEIHYEWGEGYRYQDCTIDGCGPNCECGRFVEIWNLVFMQYNRDQSGDLTPLPSPCVDTGMGLERLTAVLQKTYSNFGTDLLSNISSSVWDWHAPKPPHELASHYPERYKRSHNVIADATRAATFLLADGVIPSNEGRGYILRKIVRRALRWGKKLEMSELFEQPFLHKLVNVVADNMGDTYRELRTQHGTIVHRLQREEESYFTTIRVGMDRIEEIVANMEQRSETTIPGDELFKLYDTFGFPLEAAREIADEKGFTLDEAGFQKHMEAQRDRARKGSKFAAGPDILSEPPKDLYKTEFRGYTELEVEDCEVNLLGLPSGWGVDELKNGERGSVIMNPTPFYPEGGGQVGDQGWLLWTDGKARVEKTQKYPGDVIVQWVSVEEGILRINQKVIAQVDKQKRTGAVAHHDATHLLHQALREVLGRHVQQQGSFLDDARLRFDFSQPGPVEPGQLREIEALVNAKIREDLEITTREMSFTEAMKLGALAFFGDKYGNRVRVCRMGDWSIELCAGTHGVRTGQIGLFTITGERGIAAGVRRIEAVAAGPALARLQDGEATLEALSALFHRDREALVPALEELLAQQKTQAREIEALRVKLAQQPAGSGAAPEVQEIAGRKVFIQDYADLDMKGLRTLGDQVRRQVPADCWVLGSAKAGKASLVVVVSDTMKKELPAPTLVKALAPIIEGGGGGRETMAWAGGRRGDKIPEALNAARAALGDLLASETERAQ